jgi:hypothetical protein
MKRRLRLVGLGAALSILAVLAGVRLYPYLAPTAGFASPDGSLMCSVKTACDSHEVEVFRMSGQANAHAQTADSHPTTYPYVVCCDAYAPLSTECGEDSATVLKLSSADNGHAAQASEVAYTTDVCLSAPNTAIDCQYGPTCDSGYACLATISDLTNAHVADCDGSLDYSTKVCCAATCIDRLGDTQCDDPINVIDDDTCTAAEEAYGAPAHKPGSTCLDENNCYSDLIWYDFFDVPVPAAEDAVGDGYGDDLPPIGANGVRDGAITMSDVLAVLFYVGTYDGGPPNGNGVDYDAIKGVDLNGDTLNDVTPPLHPIKEGVKYDRTPSSVPNQPWDAGPPDAAVTMSDVLAVLAQVGLSCIGP